MYKKYLITGATGFLGRAVTAEIAHKGAEIYALTLAGDRQTNCRQECTA